MNAQFLTTTTAALALLVSAQTASAGSTLKLNITNAVHHTIDIKQLSGAGETATINLTDIQGTATDKVKVTVEQEARTGSAVEAKVNIDKAGAGSGATVKQKAGADNVGKGLADVKIDGDKGNVVTILQNNHEGDVEAVASILKTASDDGPGKADHNTITIHQARVKNSSPADGTKTTSAHATITNGSNSKIAIDQWDSSGVSSIVSLGDSDAVSIYTLQNNTDPSSASISVMDSDDAKVNVEQISFGSKTANVNVRDLTLGTSIKVSQQHTGQDADIEIDGSADSKYEIYQFNGDPQISVNISNDYRTTAGIYQSSSVVADLQMSNTSDVGIEIYQGSRPAGFEINF